MGDVASQKPPVLHTATAPQSSQLAAAQQCGHPTSCDLEEPKKCDNTFKVLRPLEMLSTVQQLSHKDVQPKSTRQQTTPSLPGLYNSKNKVLAPATHHSPPLHAYMLSLCCCAVAFIRSISSGADCMGLLLLLTPGLAQHAHPVGASTPHPVHMSSSTARAPNTPLDQPCMM